MKLLVKVLLASFFVLAEVQAAEPSSPVDQSAFVNVDAKFSTTKCENPCQNPVRLDWWMMRRQDQVEVRNLQAHTLKPAPHSEIWRFNPQRKMSHLYLMHDDKRAIEYLSDDLTLLGIPGDVHQWQFISQLMTDQEFKSLRKSDQASADFQGLKTESYVGKIKEVPVDLLWIPSLRIPAKIVYHHAKSEVTVVMDKIFHGDMLKTSDAPMTSEQNLERYQQVSYVDIGDMEQDPEVQAWVNKAHGALGLHSHAQHAH